MKKAVIFLSGILVGAILFGSAVSFAASGSKNVTAQFANIKIVVDGSLVKTEQEPFLMNDRVYVPLRTVAEAMGKEVGWESSTVLIGSMKQSLLLTDLMHPTETSLSCSSGASMAVNGTPYAKGFYVNGKDSPTGNLSFYVRGKGIKKMGGTIGLDDSSPDSVQSVDLAIFKDSAKVWEGTINRGEAPIPVSFEVEDSINSVNFKFSKLAKAKIDFIDFTAGY